jgi:hypothetical protein
VIIKSIQQPPVDSTPYGHIEKISREFPTASSGPHLATQDEMKTMQPMPLRDVHNIVVTLMYGGNSPS